MPSAADCATLQAIFEGVDAARAEAEREWGAERLPVLVSDDLRAKLRRQQERWSRAYQAAWESQMLTRGQLKAVQSAAGGMKRAWSALAEAATEAGHRPLRPDVWEILLGDGSVLALVRTNDEAAAVTAAGRHLRVLTAAEVANVWQALPVALQVAKIEFPGSKFVGAGDRSWVADCDPIPFGDAA